MRNVLLVGFVSCSLAGTASAQTTQCRWIGSVWTCEQQRSSSVQWQNGVVPDVGGNAMDAFYRGRREREEADRAKLEAERLAAERDFYRSQTPSGISGQGQPNAPTQATPPSNYGQIWLANAEKRRHLFRDFDKVVFAPDVKISEEMVMFMSSSPYAADIAYYLGTHKAESLAISRMPLLDAARAIDVIESRIKSNVESGK